MNRYNYDENLDEIGPENQAVVDLLKRVHFIPRSSYQADLWKKLHRYQSQQDKRNYRMSSFVGTSLFGKVLRLGLTAGVSSILVVTILLGGMLIVSPSARAQAQKLLIRFVEVDSPEELWLERPREEVPLPETNEIDKGLAPSDDAAVAPKEGELAQSTDSTGPPVSADSVPPSSPNLDGQALPSVSGQPAPPVVSPPTFQRNSLPNAPALISLEEAQSRVTFTIQTPTWLPEGYSLQGVMIPLDLSAINELPRPAEAPQLPVPAVATLHFSNNAGDILLLSQVQQAQLQLPGLSSPETLLPVPRDKGKVQEVTINGQPGQYIEMISGRQLHWQNSTGMMYDLMSATLDQTTLIHIAESVQ